MSVKTIRQRLQKLEVLSGGPSFESKLATVYQFAMKQLPDVTGALVKHATRLRSEGRESEFTPEHHAALQQWDDSYIDALTEPNVRFTISEMDQFLEAE